MFPPASELTAVIRKALEEDIGPGDITTSAAVNENIRGKGKFLLKNDGIIAGLNIAEEVFKLTDKGLKFSKFVDDGSYHYSGEYIAEVGGKISSILTAERTALNFLQRMSGIATASYNLADKIRHTKAKIIDTRKTVPGLRLTDKMAVQMGGCSNHRIGLYDMFLIKDNHIEAAGSITAAVEACRDYNRKNSSSFKIEVETSNLEEVEEALRNNPDVIMLDNFSIENMRKAVKLINNQCLTEASGMVNQDNVLVIAETGVDFISVGAITHSVKALDISLEVTKE